jgi:hypothetical protein
MFVALNIKDRTRVTSIDPDWDDLVETLRELVRSGQLVCPGCKQELWLRTGIRRRHFAHRSLADCPLESQSAAVWETKAQLYLWLQTKYPGHVQLDKAIALPGGEKVADLVVEPESDRKFAYWVFDRQQRDRQQFLDYHSSKGLRLHFVHTFSTLTSLGPRKLALTASQRDFIRKSGFDDCLTIGGDGHLHFFNNDNSTMTICRGLWCVHRPNVYTSEVTREDPLSNALISPKTGEIVFPADVEARQVWLQALKLQQKEKAARLAALRAQPRKSAFIEPRTKPPVGVQPEPEPVERGDPETEQPEEAAPPDIEGETERNELNQTAPELTEESANPDETEEQSMNINGPFRCEDCGQETTDWSIAAPSEGTCVCRKCTHERWLRRTNDQHKWK